MRASPELPVENVISATSQRGGGRAGINAIKWNKPAEDVERLRLQLLKRNDIRRVQKALADFGIRADASLIEAVKRYNFDSQGIAFTPDNYQGWKRLANGNGTIDDARYFIHEMTEVTELQCIQQSTGFDFMGANWQNLTRRQRIQWKADFDRYYMEAHTLALKAECEFLAQQISAATKGETQVSPEEVAATDPTRDEARQYMLADGVCLKEHHNFSLWQQRARETVFLGTKVKNKLNLTSNPTLADLIDRMKGIRLKDLPW